MLGVSPENGTVVVGSRECGLGI